MLVVKGLYKFLLLVLLSFNAYSDAQTINTASSSEFKCKTSLVDDFIDADHAVSIDIVLHKYRKWTKNYLSLVKDSHKSILDKYKQKFKADISVLFNNGLFCQFPAEIRIQGDYRDHISKLPPITSLNVKLLKGNINSATKFKLLLPRTRNGDNEIFITTLLKELNFLSPKTYYVPVNFNDQKIQFIFQEKISKEFIESNGLREGPILEGDERFVFAEEPFNLLTRIVNYKWTNLGASSLSISKEAVSSLNSAYLSNLLGHYKGTHSVYSLDFDILGNNKTNIKKNQEFQSLLVALKSAHGLAPHNRSFYYDPMYKHFIPIYYDGMSNILNGSKVTYQDLLYGGSSFSEGEIIGASYAITSIQNLDKKKFIKQLKIYGVDISSQKLDQTIDIINSHLHIISNSLSKDQIDSYQKYFSIFNEPEKILAFTNNKLQIESCNFSLSSCMLEKLSQKEYSQLLGAKYKNSKGFDYIFVGNKIDYKEGHIAQNIKKSKFKSFDIENDSRLITFGLIESSINNKSKVINLYQKSKDDKALIVGGELENWKINFFGIEQNVFKNEQRFDENLLTGCLTLLDMNVKSIDISVEKSTCEDAVNFIRVSGSVNKIKIQHSPYDGLDLDYSDLNFVDINIYNAGNDCLDLSAGNYKIGHSNLNKCHDKAVSVGEQTNATFNDIQILNSNLGVVSKDSSEVNITNVTFKNTELCFSAYNKKQEFWGGKIIVAEHNCQPIRMYQQKNSLIEILQ